MNTKLLELAIESLRREVERLQSEVGDLKLKMAERKRVEKKEVLPSPSSTDDELLDTKEVLKILGVSYNTFQKIVKKGLVKSLRISPRRVRFTKLSIQQYIGSLQSSFT